MGIRQTKSLLKTYYSKQAFKESLISLVCFLSNSYYASFIFIFSILFYIIAYLASNIFSYFFYSKSLFFFSTSII